MSGSRRHRVPFLMLSIGCIALGIGDVAWFFLAQSGVDPFMDHTLWVLYFLTNTLLCAAFLFIWISHFSKWNHVHLFADIVAILMVSSVFGWVVILRHNWDALIRLSALDFASAASLYLDGILTIGVFPWFATARSEQIQPYSIDDFGSGYASMGHLGQYPLNRIKIDKSLIDGLLVRGGSE